MVEALKAQLELTKATHKQEMAELERSQATDAETIASLQKEVGLQPIPYGS